MKPFCGYLFSQCAGQQSAGNTAEEIRKCFFPGKGDLRCCDNQGNDTKGENNGN